MDLRPSLMETLIWCVVSKFELLGSYNNNLILLKHTTLQPYVCWKYFTTGRFHYYRKTHSKFEVFVKHNKEDMIFIAIFIGMEVRFDGIFKIFYGNIFTIIRMYPLMNLVIGIEMITLIKYTIKISILSHI